MLTGVAVEKKKLKDSFQYKSPCVVTTPLDQAAARSIVRTKMHNRPSAFLIAHECGITQQA